MKSKVLQNILISYSRVNKRLDCNIKVTDMSHPVTPMYQCDKPPPDENDLNLIIINIQNLKKTFQFNYFDNTELISFSSAS